jgi:hypothetical protein
MKKIDWKKNIWEFVKKFPAVSYGISGLTLLVVINSCEWCSNNMLLSFVALPFFLTALIFAGLSNIIPKYSFDIFNEILPLIVFLLILLSLDIFIFLLRKLLEKFFGKNLFTKVTLIISTLLLWFYVFLRLINSLPIDV